MGTTLERAEGSELRQPSPGKAFYTIFPKKGTETSKSSEFVKNIVGTDLLPWTNLQEQLISWTVEASPDEVTLMRNYDDIEKVVPYPMEPPAQPGTPRTVPRTGRRDVAENPPTVHGYFVFPKDGKNKDETDKTELFLQQLFGAEHIEPPFRFDDEDEGLLYWLVENSNESQRDQAAKDPGVKVIEPNKASFYRLRTARNLPPDNLHPLPLPTAKLSNTIENRDISNSTY
ncbi:uncharacterized protein BP5553_05978 [Venustampulla echinocandica]|uniref:Uncharacterized protein n=1 Tax=Venustampulla echinocandica TaxID=2656787 RepID=A0A370TM76_9HELO|nr:uncharacterized protein BP5553_05978 [Venustampulla echinocandica]RDL36626.1 hypothetical protein BP5553_05978 [Venustampulla echinocandica]